MPPRVVIAALALAASTVGFEAVAQTGSVKVSIFATGSLRGTFTEAAIE